MEVKIEENKKQKHRLQHHHRIYQNINEDHSPSFAQFLLRAQEKIDYRNKWIYKMRQIKDQN
jgi:hypothetical protein